ncbi:hypothetical protein SP19_184 [Salmonella phage 19]|nr:hypothetical protein SP19_184 [Salmonella phage 19]
MQTSSTQKDERQYKMFWQCVCRSERGRVSTHSLALLVVTARITTLMQQIKKYTDELESA